MMVQIDKEELERLRLVEKILRGVVTSELSALVVAAFEAYEGVQTNLAPGPWSEVKMRLIDAAIAFGKRASE